MKFLKYIMFVFVSSVLDWNCEVNAVRRMHDAVGSSVLNWNCGADEIHRMHDVSAWIVRANLELWSECSP